MFAFQWSLLAFVLAAALAGLGHTYWGGESGTGPWSWLRGGDRKAVPPGPELEVPEAPPFAQDGVVRRSIDGQILSEGGQDGPYMAVMIDNHYAARPLSGLSEAPLVYEAPVEGGITRMMAIYPFGELVKKIGPVRSARPYYLDWAAEFDAMYVHVGGSPEALDLLKAGSLPDLNEFWNGRYFWRDTSRRAPHAVFTSVGLLGQAWAAKYDDRERPEIESWEFKPDRPLEERPEEVADLVIDWSSPINRVAWEYRRQENDYRRLQADERQLDEEDRSPIHAKNVIVQYHPIKVIDSVGRREIRTTGQGKAYVLTDGRVIEAVWHKDGAADRTRYLTPEGDEVFFNVGSSWVHVVPEGLEIKGLNRPEDNSDVSE